MKRPVGMILLAMSLTLLQSFAPSPAAAGNYDVRACIYEAPLHFDARWEQYGAGRVDVVHNCNTLPRGWFGIYQTRKGTPFANGEGAGFRWYAPAEASFVASRVLGKLRNANGIAAQFYATNPNGGYHSLDANTPHDGAERVMHMDFSSSPRSQVAMRLACLSNPPCSNRAGDVKAFLELRNITLTLRDSTPPAVTAGGDLFSGPPAQAIYRGNVGFSYTASDAGGGLQQPWAEINSTVVDLGSYYCGGAHAGFADRTQPCPSHETRHATFDTSRPPFAEGENRARICVRDYATAGTANVSCTAVRQFTVDNTAPSAPEALTVEGGEDWRVTNSFNLSWTNPADQTTPIVAAHYRLEDAGNGAVVQAERQVNGIGVKGLQGIRMPRVGAFRIRIWLRDAAGNTGAAAVRLLRLDDRPPGDVSPLPAQPWLSTADFPYRHGVTPAVAGGPSGVLGYAATLAADRPREPCPSGRCSPAEVRTDGFEDGVVEIEDLAHGSHWLTVAAVSGARLRSREAHSVLLRVDSEAPTTTLSGVPEGWSREPVKVAAKATDRASGMEPNPAQPGGPPLTMIQLEGQPVHSQVGADATLVIECEGVHRLKHWARDLAGNTNDGKRSASGRRHDPPGEATVRLDWSAPEIGFLAQDRQRPELIQARLRDELSGPGGGEISFRPSGSERPFTPLVTHLVDDRLEAHLPSDDLAEGAYEFQAVAWDRAGNVSQGSLREDGSAMVLQVPLKGPVAIIAAFARGSSARQVLKHGATTVVEGRLVDAEGTPLADAPVELVERFDRGARTEMKVTSLVSDAQGSFRARLRPGPSRRVSARYPGDRLLARTESAALRLVSRSQVGFAITPQVVRNRDVVLMRGRVQGRDAVVPAAGKLVAIQYLDPTRRRWRPAELVRTDRRGRFRHRYRFRTVTGPQRFIFRAVAPTEAGWPYRPARSGGKGVVVYPR